MYYNENFVEEISEIVLGQRIVSIQEDTITLGNGVTLGLYTSNSECCASAYGTWEEEEGLEAIITKVTLEAHQEDNGDGTFTTGVITFLHNRNPVARAYCEADGGNGGYYFSVLSLRVTMSEEVFHSLAVIST